MKKLGWATCIVVKCEAMCLLYIYACIVWSICKTRVKIERRHRQHNWVREGERGENEARSGDGPSGGDSATKNETLPGVGGCNIVARAKAMTREKLGRRGRGRKFVCVLSVGSLSVSVSVSSKLKRMLKRAA